MSTHATETQFRWHVTFMGMPISVEAADGLSFEYIKQLGLLNLYPAARGDKFIKL